MSHQWTVDTGEVLTPTTTPEMRRFCQRPGRRDKDGNIVYFTQQKHKKECDVNEIIQKYDKNGLITHVSKFEAKFGDMTGLDFKRALDTVRSAQSMFEELPAEVKRRFRQSPEELLRFMEDPGNRAEAIELGLIDSRWTEATDGLGEHVLEGENVIQEEEPLPKGKKAPDEKGEKGA